MHTQRLLAKQLFNGTELLADQVLTIAEGKIQAVDQDIHRYDQVLDGLVAPGYIDLQVNGGGNVLFNASPSLASLTTIMTAHAQFGTVAMLPTFITDSVEQMQLAAQAIAQAIASNETGILGVHFEGPHLSQPKKGAHSSGFIRALSEQELAIYQRDDLGKKLLTIAPETVPPEQISEFIQAGCKVCLGHTNADFETATQAQEAGADGITHLFNAMSGLQGRAPGVLGAALLNDEVSCGLIVDGHHVAWSMCHLAIKTKPQGKVFLVTDAMPVVGTTSEEFAFFDRTVHLHDGKLTSTTGELAGSALDMATAVRNCVNELKLPLEQALNMASLYPAQYIGCEQQLGKLEAGFNASFVVLDQRLAVQQTWINGKLHYKN